MVAVNTYRVTAKHWDQGWELHVDGVGVTQVRVLANAEQQACDLIETMTGEEVPATAIDLHLDLDGVDEYVQDVRRQADEAQAAAQEAAAASRKMVRTLRVSHGLSVSDVATILGVSRARISQLSERADAP